MNRARRPAKPFVSGGVYDASQGGAAAGPPTPRNYSYQNTPKRLPQTPQQQKNTTPQVVPKPVQAEPVAPVVLPTPILKDEPAPTPPEVDNSYNTDETMHVEEDDAGEDSAVPTKKGKLMFKKIFANRKKSSVRAKEKKIRQNRQLRKVILPKNALMALNEVKGINVGDFVINSNVGGGFSAVVCVNGNQYEGKGSSKVIAKNNACEKALRDYVLAKMRQKPRLQSRTVSVSGETAMDTTDENGENGDNADGGDTQNPTQDEADDVPMINLTSFALYKLFSEWENEGFEIPEFHPSANGQANANDSDGGSTAVKEPKKPTIRNELPANWETMHPATLLCMMRPGLTYSDYGIIGEKPNAIQSLGVIVDDQEFIGKGRSKKIARRNTAANVCNTLFGTNFELEESVAAPAAS